MKILVILCNVVLAFYFVANAVIFYAIPNSLAFSTDVFSEGRYDYPSVAINKPVNSGGAYYYPLISIEIEDDCEYALVKDGFLGYTVDSTSFLKRHKYDLIVYNSDFYYGSTYDACYKLYKDGELIDMVPCVYLGSINDRSYYFDCIMQWGATNKIFILIDIALLCAYIVFMLCYIVKYRRNRRYASAKAIDMKVQYYIQ